jgi:hypothetical protein
VGVSATATSNPVSGAAICFVTFEVLDAGGLLVDVNDLTSAPSSVQVSAVAAAPQMRDGGFAILAG